MLYDRCRGGTAEIGGINNTSGVLKILDEKGKEIGRWDKLHALALFDEFNEADLRRLAPYVCFD